ncbi:hypothetical protein JRQ81_015327 [Phrynocephalus forsythii]|uniref:Uncharacterized protein n=1 Tax=Phrynocephalus forsythii TaxID=171643 RepID=A0A9Q0XTP9_9SAUR|nr:hypothetical protein JRQ81_015327 [Phrynocephalus forsythii]
MFFFAFPEGESLEDWVLRLSKHILDSAGYLGESQKGLLEMSCKKVDRVEKAPSVLEKSDASEEEAKGTMLLHVPVSSQPVYKPLPLNEEENRLQLMEDKVVEVEMIIPLHEETSRKEQKFPVLVENRNQSTLDKLGRGPNKDSGKSASSVKLEYIGLEAIPGNSGNDVFVSRELEECKVNSLQRFLQQTEIKEIQEHAENNNHCLREKTEKKCNNMSQEKSSEITQCDQECSTVSEDIPVIESAALSSSSPKEEDHENDWIYKEFLSEVNGESEPEVACGITAPCSVLQNLKITVVNDLSSLVVDDSEELVSNVVSAEWSQNGQPITSPIIVAIPYTSRYRGMYRDVMVKVTNGNFQSCYLTPMSLEGHQGHFKVS